MVSSESIFFSTDTNRMTIQQSLSSIKYLSTSNRRFEPPINTASELAASGILWAANHNAWIFSIRDAEEPEMKTLVRNFRVLSKKEISKEAEKNSWGFSIERLQGGK